MSLDRHAQDLREALICLDRLTRQDWADPHARQAVLQGMAVHLTVAEHALAQADGTQGVLAQLELRCWSMVLRRALASIEGQSRP